MPDADASPFPPRDAPTVRVDSIPEESAYLAAWPPAAGPWQRAGQMLVPGPDGPEDHVTVRAPDGTTTVVRFATGSFYGNAGAARDSSGIRLNDAATPEGGAKSPPLPCPTGAGCPLGGGWGGEGWLRRHAGHHPESVSPGDRVTRAMRAGHELARAEGPLHPGSLPQYPVPSESYPGAVAVPLPILAVDAGQRGLYAPPRIAVVRWPSAEPVGVGDAPGFDPARWPPPLLGEWPPPAVRAWEPQRLAATIERFTAVWGRLLDAWFGSERYAQNWDERREARRLLGKLSPRPLLECYASMAPDFWTWLHENRER